MGLSVILDNYFIFRSITLIMLKKNIIMYENYRILNMY